MIITEVLEMPYNGVIAVARPLEELSSHLTDYKLPSISLLIRAVKAISLSFFTGHYCDKIVVHGQYSLVHNLNGKVTHSSLSELMDEYPYLFEKSLYFVFKDYPNPEGKVEMRDFAALKGISAQTISDYYRSKHNYKITDKVAGNTVSDILKSNSLKPLGTKKYLEFGFL